MLTVSRSMHGQSNSLSMMGQACLMLWARYSSRRYDRLPFSLLFSLSIVHASMYTYIRTYALYMMTLRLLVDVCHSLEYMVLILLFIKR